MLFRSMVTENMFGDILSDLGASLVGGMGMAPSADTGERGQVAVFQPSHGTASALAGLDAANPVAAILSGAYDARAQTVAIVLSGGNIDLDVLERCLKWE